MEREPRGEGRARARRPVRVLALIALLAAAAACSGEPGGAGESAAPPSTGPATTAAPPSTTYHGTHTTAATIDGPVTGGRGRAWRAEPDLGSMGFTEEELFASGTTTNGPYKIRLLVRRPSDPAKFNGTVVTEWMNVTAGFEFDVDWGLFKQEILRSGYAYVGVGVQSVGINATREGNRFGPYPGLKEFDGERYAPLAHPGDAGAAEIFTQVGHAVRTDPKVLGGLPVFREIATGQSQSAGLLSTYVTNVHKDAMVYDAFFLHSGFGEATNPTRTPVLRFNSELEAGAVWAAMRDTHPDTDTFRYWETAGTGHTPSTALGGVRDTAQREGIDPTLTCDYPTTDFPTIEYAGHAALDALDNWLRTGTPPPSKPLMELTGPAGPPPGPPGRGGLSFNANLIARDADGNAKGGIRLPHVEVPIGRHLATNSPASNASCLLTPGFDAFDGQTAATTPGDTWDEPTLAQRYPTHQDYVDKVKAAVARAQADGVLLPADGEQLVKEADAARIP
jgi:hypothetical protein